MWKEIPPFSFSAGERKIMAHFVVNPTFLIFGCGVAALCPFDFAQDMPSW
ncbi:MAG: hypothetical protein HYU46_07060 [Deltaproteobacteria bacterium]|nr:hypothetical protein [Deltaproteobacteria bacterium]MBI2367586.1 hypothetical protein [Deltaproteobacteria bacterium]MBI2533052.1 hypothetical protein [Deltaproteobacteria bacterium]MBI3064024.1 hypothetical protein [Deltaproteobacteria bacterium]